MPSVVDDKPTLGGYVCVGWPSVGNIFELPEDREVFKARLKSAYPDKKAGAIPVDAGTLFRFAHDVAEGDIVVWPSKHNRRVNIGVANGKKWHAAGNEVDGEDFPNFLGVNWQTDVPREKFSQAALNEIGSFITLFRIRNHANQFRACLTDGQEAAHDEDDVVPDDLATQGVSRIAEESTQDFVIRRLSNGLSGHDFEHLVAHLLECMGYSARVTEKSGDGGVDVIAHTDELGFQPPIIKVQCKLQSDTVGEPEIHQLIGTLGEGEFGLFVTLSSYSRPARLRERTAPRLRLLDGEDFVELLQEHYPKLSPRYRTMIPLRQIYIPDLIPE
ncbi:restriction endonuclease [Erythrobacteraceae bacterium WH01K]|nr:restriction endonuclease [Erythrobacteraceae bacterium WH01K]